MNLYLIEVNNRSPNTLQVQAVPVWISIPRFLVFSSQMTAAVHIAQKHRPYPSALTLKMSITNS